MCLKCGVVYCAGFVYHTPQQWLLLYISIVEYCRLALTPSILWAEIKWHTGHSMLVICHQHLFHYLQACKWEKDHIISFLVRAHVLDD